MGEDLAVVQTAVLQVILTCFYHMETKSRRTLKENNTLILSFCMGKRHTFN